MTAQLEDEFLRRVNKDTCCAKYKGREVMGKKQGQPELNGHNADIPSHRRGFQSLSNFVRKFWNAGF
jgi:hypothetical protein